ncbi:MAG: hypothetical protein OER12_06905 [Acidimicrobiia bacterium]|nr:hypothetical protein [Acidimicrobiia bacterium]
MAAARRIYILGLALVLVAVACRSSEGSVTTPPPGGQIVAAPVTTTTTTTPVLAEDNSLVGTDIWLVDPLTLERRGEPVRLPGYVGQAAALADGRLVIRVAHSPPLLVVLDPTTMTTTSHEYPPVWGNIDFVTSNPTNEVVLIRGESPTLGSFSADSGTFEDGIATSWAWQSQLLSGGQRLASYNLGREDELGSLLPPRVDVVDIETGDILVEFELPDVAHGSIPINPDLAADPKFPYAFVHPGLAWDAEQELIYVVHADGNSISVGDLATGSVETRRLGESPSLWATAFAWLIPPAEAKGAANEAVRQAWLNGDGTRLISTGTQHDYLRNQDNGQLTIISQPLEVLIIDTTTLEVLERLDLGTTRGSVSPDGSRWILTGEDSRQVVCDELCHGVVGGDPEFVVDDTIFAGLYIIDTGTLEIVAHLEPGSNYYTQSHHGHQLITEHFGPDGDFYESIDVQSGEVTGRVGFGEQWYLANEAGVFELKVNSGSEP